MGLCHIGRSLWYNIVVLFPENKKMIRWQSKPCFFFFFFCNMTNKVYLKKNTFMDM